MALESLAEVLPLPRIEALVSELVGLGFLRGHEHQERAAFALKKSIRDDFEMRRETIDLLESWLIEFGAGRRELLWTDRQRLVGWLASRTPMQMLTVRSRPSSIGLRVLGPADAKGLKAKNDLGTRLRHVAVCDADRNYFYAERIEPGATFVLPRIDSVAIAAKMDGVYEQARPRLPENADAAAFSGGTYRYSYYSFRYGSSTPRADGSRMELALRQCREGPATALTPRTYVAIAERSSEVELGVDDAREEGSFHVIMGRW
jgi:hypothetical protein